MADIDDDAQGGGYRRVEILTGPGRRRRWSEDAKARIVAETLEAGAVASEVARRWQVCAQQVFTWRRQMRGGSAAGSAAPLAFVPIVPGQPDVSSVLPAASSSPIEVALAGGVVRVAPGTDAALLALVLRAMRASAA